MEYFNEGIVPLRYWYIKLKWPNVKSKIYKKKFFGVYLHQSLDRALSSRKNTTSRQSLKVKLPLLSWWRLVFYEVSDCDLEKIPNNFFSQDYFKILQLALTCSLYHTKWLWEITTWRKTDDRRAFGPSIKITFLKAWYFFVVYYTFLALESTMW